MAIQKGVLPELHTFIRSAGKPHRKTPGQSLGCNIERKKMRQRPSRFLVGCLGVGSCAHSSGSGKSLILGCLYRPKHPPHRQPLFDASRRPAILYWLRSRIWFYRIGSYSYRPRTTLSRERCVEPRFVCIANPPHNRKVHCPEPDGHNK